VLFILLVTLAGLGIVVVNALSNSPWGVFTIGMTIPIAVIMGLWMFKSHAGKITVTGPSIFGSSRLAGTGTARLSLDLRQAGHDRRPGRRRFRGSSQHPVSKLHAVCSRRRSDHQRKALPIPLRDHCLRRDLGLSLAGVLRHNTENAG